MLSRGGVSFLPGRDVPVHQDPQHAAILAAFPGFGRVSKPSSLSNAPIFLVGLWGMRSKKNNETSWMTKRHAVGAIACWI